MAVSGRARSARGMVVLLVAISLVVITIDYREGREGPLARIGSVLLSAVIPLQEAVSKVTRPIGNFFSGFAQTWSLRAENERLRDELQRAQSLVPQFDALQHDYDEIARLLDLGDTLFPHLEVQGATVIGNGFANEDWAIQINKGARDGVAIDMPVVAPAGLVGRVTAVAATGATVRLMLDPNESVAAELVTSQGSGLVQGQGDRPPVMSLLPGSVDVELGESVVTTTYRVAEEQGLYPPLIPIGRVADVRETAGTSEVQIVVEPFVDFSSLNHVLVVLTEADE